MSTVPSYLLLAVWVVVAIVAAATRDYAFALLAATVIIFAAANILTMRFLAQRIAAKDQEIAARQRWIAAQERQISILNQQIAAQPHTRTDKKDPQAL